MGAGQLKRNFIRIYRVVLAVVHSSGHINDLITGYWSLAQGLDDALFHCGDEVARDIAADDLIEKLKTFTTPFGGNPQKYLAELPPSARLLLVSILRIGVAADRFSIGNPRHLHINLHAKPLFQATNDNFQMQLTLGQQDRLADLTIVFHDEARIFLVQLSNPRRDAILAALFLGVNSHAN